MTAEYVVQMELVNYTVWKSHVRLEWDKGNLDPCVSVSIRICLSIVGDGDIRFHLSLDISIYIIPWVTKEVIAFAVRCKFGKGGHGSDTVGVTGKSIIMCRMDVSIELTLHL
jgi:hypothetical protein